jgi:hypothetical protein
MRWAQLSGTATVAVVAALVILPTKVGRKTHTHLDQSTGVRPRRRRSRDGCYHVLAHCQRGGLVAATRWIYRDCLIDAKAVQPHRWNHRGGRRLHRSRPIKRALCSPLRRCCGQ